jgi:hypothetical protein
MQSLCTLRTPRCRDARNTRYRAARYALPGRDLHPLDRVSFAWRTFRDPTKIEIYKGLPKDPADRRVFDVPTEDRLKALAALQEAGRQRAAALGLAW